MIRKRKRKYLLLSILAAIFLFVGGYLVITTVHAPEIKKNEEVVSPKPVLPKPSVSTTTTTLPTGTYKTLTLNIHEKALFAGSSIEPYAIIEDSRCARGVQCIWAGRLRIGIGIFESDGIKNFVLQEGESTTTAHLSITFVGGSPYPKAGSVISENEYILTLNVKKN